jgi:hypothetical protein
LLPACGTRPSELSAACACRIWLGSSAPLWPSRAAICRAASRQQQGIRRQQKAVVGGLFTVKGGGPMGPAWQYMPGACLAVHVPQTAAACFDSATHAADPKARPFSLAALARSYLTGRRYI